MRLWHYKLINLLPKQQLVAQWRELNSIFEKQNKHILINYIYEYSYKDLMNYSLMIILEMKKRGYKIKSYDNFYNWLTPHMESRFGKIVLKAFKDSNLNEQFLIGFLDDVEVFIHHHNDDYYKICCTNLWEKYIRGQPGFTHEAILEISEKFYE